MGEERVEPFAGDRRELLEARRPGRRHGRVDAAARGEDLGVAHAAEARGVLVGPRAGEDGVGVGVDEAGQHAGAGRVELGGAVEQLDGAAELRLAADPDDTTVARRQSAVAEDPEAVVVGRRVAPAAVTVVGESVTSSPA